ncbi:CapA family protein [Halovivax limisalsi]|uniref:CapA family protein n=1 Tax=Halovivax limisalsi TaxID=1453760 RepID=UPI001FFC4146|nr:CapA family protein [Halovivax limisalsi]
MTPTRRRFVSTAGLTAGATALAGCALPRSDRTEPGRSDRATTWIGFAGDAMLGRNLDDRYGSPAVDPAAVWSDLRPRLESLDAVCCNLECCLSTRGERFPDRAYYFRADPAWAVPALDAGNVRCTALANNHLLDFGPVALRDTVAALDDAGIANAGAGETPAAVYEPATFAAGDATAAAVSFADHYAEYGVREDRPGTAYVESDPANERTRRIVREAIERALTLDPDLLVASVHLGPNWVVYPDDDLAAFHRWLIELGADLVHGHSAHVVQGVERYRDGLILHDTGDIVDDYVIKDDLRNDRTFLFEVGLAEDGAPVECRLVPAVIEDETVRRAASGEAAWLRETMRERSAPFGTTYERDGEHLVLAL